MRRQILPNSIDVVHRYVVGDVLEDFQLLDHHQRLPTVNIQTMEMEQLKLEH